MKHILTLLFSLTLFTATFAQTDAERKEAKRVILGGKNGSTTYPKSGDNRDVIYGGDDRTVYGGSQRYPERYPTTSGSSRERRVYEINRAYDKKIYSIRQNRTLSRTEKERRIRHLENERRRKLDEINGSYYSKDRRYADDDCNDRKKYKKNNGNHYGWEKGKGNPHRGK